MLFGSALIWPHESAQTLACLALFLENGIDKLFPFGVSNENPKATGTVSTVWVVVRTG